MTIRKILLPVLQGYAFSAQLNAAFQLMHGPSLLIDAVFIPSSLAHAGGPEATISISDLVADDDITFEDAADEDSADEALARANFKVWRAAHNLASGHTQKVAGVSSATWRRSHNSIETEIIASGRLSDLIILNRPNPHEAPKQRAFDAALFGTGRPALFVFDEIPDDILHHVLIAWNGSIEATRAVAASMPLLERAARVSLFTATGHDDPPRGGLDISELLTCHDVQPHKLHTALDEKSVGAALLKAAAYHGATMLVMGAYSHSHIREMLFDGVTLHVVQHGTIPVLMIH
jgi:nucleotide-binding universal stress UspA family protein